MKVVLLLALIAASWARNHATFEHFLTDFVSAHPLLAKPDDDVIGFSAVSALGVADADRVRSIVGACEEMAVVEYQRIEKYAKNGANRGLYSIPNL